jgi:type I restriction enzyme S subunit
MAKIGEAVRLNRRAILGQATLMDNNVMGWVPHSDAVLSEYLFYASLSLRLADISHATTVPSVRKSDVVQLSIPVPPLDEQQRVVERTKERLAAIDGAVGSLGTAEVRGRALRLATLERALDPSWPRRALKETILSLKNGIFVSRPAAEPPGIPIFRISAVRPMHLRIEDIRYAPAETKKPDDYFVCAGDLLFTRYSGNADFVGACAIVPNLPEPTLHPDKLIRVVVDPGVLDPSFAELACSAGQTLSEIRARRKTTSGQVGISGRDLKEVTVPVPSLEVQREAVAEAHAALDAVEELVGNVGEAQMQAERLRQSVLVDACGGSRLSRNPLVVGQAEG